MLVMQERCEKIHAASMAMLAKTGMKYHNPKAIEILKAHDIRVEGNVAYFTEEQLMYWVRKAPSCFTLYARNPKYNMTIGGSEVNPVPLYGCAHIADKDGNKRQATIQDYVNYAKLFHANDDFKIDGGLMVQPFDVPIPSSCLSMFYATYTHSDKALFCVAGKEQYMDAMMEAAEVAFGGKEELLAHPHLITIVNANTPLQLDVMMTDVLIKFAEYGQPIVIAPCDMAGSTSPVTIAGTVAMSTAEALATIALAQMVRPGTPVIMGSQSTTADMKTGQIAIGAPEGALCYRYLGQMAKFYHLPSRAGGALTDSKIVDTQAGIESFMTYLACAQNEVNFIIHAAGILDGYAYTSYEKVISDFEVVRYVTRYLREFDINEDTIPLDLIDEVGHEGEYLTKDHTFMHCRTEALAPDLCSRGNVQNPAGQYGLNIEKKYAALMDKYAATAPELDADITDKMKAILEKQGIERSLLDAIEKM